MLPFVFVPPSPTLLLCEGGGGGGSNELEKEVLEGVQALAGFPQCSIRAQLGSQEEQLPVLGHGAQRQGLMQLRHAHSIGLIL